MVSQNNSWKRLSLKLLAEKIFGWQKFKQILQTKIIYCEKIKKTISVFLPLDEEDGYHGCPCIWFVSGLLVSKITTPFYLISVKLTGKLFSVI